MTVNTITVKFVCYFFTFFDGQLVLFAPSNPLFFLLLEYLLSNLPTSNFLLQPA